MRRSHPSPKPLIEIVGPRVRRLRLERGLTLCALAAEIGMDRGDLSRLETSRGPQNFGIERLAQVARGLHVPVRRLFADDPVCPRCGQRLVGRAARGSSHQSTQHP